MLSAAISSLRDHGSAYVGIPTLPSLIDPYLVIGTTSDRFFNRFALETNNIIRLVCRYKPSGGTSNPA